MSSVPGGLGVCTLEGGMGVTERETIPGSLGSLDSMRSVNRNVNDSQIVDALLLPSFQDMMGTAGYTMRC
jgi:hypothetical protein